MGGGPGTAAPTPGLSRAAGEGCRSAEVALLIAIVDEIVSGLDAPDAVDELARAREEYAARRGRVFEDEELWERWTQGMLEWCAVERPWRGGPAPAHAWARRESEPERRAALAAWARSLRTLVSVEALEPGRVVLRDLVGGALIAVDEDRELYGVEIGDVTEVRLLGHAGRVRFGRTFCFHPPEAGDALARIAAARHAAGDPRADIVDGAATLRIRCERYRHVPAARIYAGISLPPAGRPSR